MRVANMVPDMQYAVQQSQQALSVALQQVSTGLRVNQPSDDPAASANMVISLAGSANVDQYTSNVSAVTSQLDTADSALSSVATALNTAITLGTSGATGSASTANRQSIAAQLEGILSSVVGQANSAYQGVYLFAGSANNLPPFVPASTTFTSTQGSVATPLLLTTPLTAGSTTTVSDAAIGKPFSYTAVAGDTINTLVGAISGAVAAGTLPAGTVATFFHGQLEIGSGSVTDGIGVRSNDPALGPMTANPTTEVLNSYAYLGNSTVNSVQVGDSSIVNTNVPGDQLFTTGTNVLSSLGGLITALQNGTSTQIGTASTAVATALSSISQQRIPLDNTITQLSSQDSFLSQERLTLTTHQTSLVGADLATAATSLSQAELDNTAVLAAASKVLPQTLLNYLAPG
jgi:flagellin-like hook-associated protein FlgL